MFNACVDIYEIRLKNARSLMSLLGGSITLMSEKIDKPQSLVSRMMGQEPTKNIGPKVARDIENKFGKSKGWLDQIHSELEQAHQEPDTNLGERALRLPGIREAPVIGQITKSQDGVVMLRQINLGHAKVFSNDKDVRCYQYDTGEYEPRIRVNEIIAVEPNQAFGTEDDVLMQLVSGEVLIKQYISEDEKYYRLDDINQKGPRARVLKSDVETIEVIGGHYPGRQIRN